MEACLVVAQNWQLLKQGGDPASQLLIGMLQDLDAEVQEGGGGSQPVQAGYSGDDTAIAYGDAASLTWDTLVSGDDLLDRTDPTTPLVLADGWYAITVLAESSAALTVGGKALLTVSSDAQPVSAYTWMLSSNAAAYGSGTLVCFLGAGSNVVAQVFNLDGAVSRNFGIEGAIVVKLA